MTDAPAADGPGFFVLLAERFARQRRCPPDKTSPASNQSATKERASCSPACNDPLVGDTSARSRISDSFWSIIDWFRVGYPDEAPTVGYSPLLALNGPLALTARQMRSVVDELHGMSADTTDIKVAITKATDRLPTQSQIRAVTTALHPNRAPASITDPDPDNLK